MTAPLSYLLMAASLLTALLGSTLFHGQATRWIMATAVAGSCACAFFIDKKISLRAAPFQIKRIIRSNCCATVFVLLPFASRCTPGTWANLILDSIVYCGAVFFVAFAGASRIEPLMQQAEIRWSHIVQRTFPVLLFVYFIVVGGQLAFSYYAYRTEWVDFSFEFAPVWQSCRNGLFRMINEFSQETTILRYHWPLLYAIISPVTLLWKNPTIVLWISTLFFTASAYTAYLLAWQYTKSKSTGALIGSLYLFYLPLHLANLYDFHADPLALPFIFMSFLYAARGKWAAFGCAMTAALLCKEYVGLLYFGYGIWLSFKNKKAGAITSAAGLLWFLLAIKIGIPFFNQGAAPMVIGANYGDLGGGQGIAGMICYSIAHPEILAAKLARQSNVVALMSIFLPFLFLPFARPWILMAGILILIKNALSESGIELLVHRETLFFPFIVYAFILYVASLTPSTRRFVLCSVSIAVVATFLLQGHAAPARGFWLTKSEYIKSAHDRACDTLLKKIPAGAVTMSSSHLAPHLMARKWYFLFPRFPAAREPEYIVVDTLEQADWGWCTRKEHQEGFGRIQKSKNYELIDQNDGVFLFKRKRG